MSNEDLNIAPDAGAIEKAIQFAKSLPSVGGDVGTEQDAQANPAQESDLSNSAEIAEDAQDANPQDHQTQNSKTDEQLRQERADAVKEAIFNAKKAKEARAESDFYKTAHQVMKNPDSIRDLYQNDPDLADQVAQENWGYSAQEVIDAYDQQAQETYEPVQRPQADPLTIRKAIREELDRERSFSEQKKVENYVQEFIIENNIDPTSYQFKQIMETYNEFNPKTLSQAKKLLSLAHGKSGGHTESAPSASIPSGGTVSHQKPKKLSGDLRGLLSRAGYSKEHFDRYEKRK